MNQMKFVRQKSTVALLFILIGVLLLLIAKKFYAAKNFLDTNSPYYFGNYAPTNPQVNDELIVVSYNIRYAEKIEQAMIELAELQAQQGLDLILLQEMDEGGVTQIAQALEFNFVYYPAAIEPRYGNKFGNAVLSRWPITDSEKIILPHKSLSSRMNRTATKATIAIKEIEILVYSIHTETKFTFPHFREDQLMAIVADVDEDADFVIIGGDFNSVTHTDVGEIEEAYRQEGFIRATRNSGHTIEKFRVKAIADLVFSKGFQIQEDGKIENALASDHLPIWVRLVLNEKRD